MQTKKQNIKKSFISEENKEKAKDRIFRDIWTLFETEEEKKERNQRKKKGHNERLIKDRLIRDIGTLFEQQEEDYYKPERVNNFWNNNYIEYESNGDKNRNLSLDKYLNKIKPYLRNVIIDLQKSDAWKIQLTITINFISSKDAEEERVMHSMSDNIKFTPYSNVNEVIDELFKSLERDQ